LATRFDLSVFKEPPNSGLTKPFAAFSWGGIYNFDGLYSATRESRAPKYLSYVQVFRNGIIEAVDADVLRRYETSTSPLIPHNIFETRLLEGVQRFLAAQKLLGVEPPVLVMVSLLGVRGYMMAVSVTHFGENQPIDRDNLVVPEVLLDSLDADVDTVMRSIFDAVWNATGWSGSPSYDSSGARKNTS
jgi:hypothetical protein